MSSLPQIPDDQFMSISSEGLQFILNHHDPQIPDKNFLWTTDYRVQLPVRVKKSGPGSEKPRTLIQMWRESLVKHSDLAALNYESSPGKWTTLTFKQYYDLSCKVGRSLIALGIPEYTAINIIGFNSVEWAVAFHGSIFAHYLPIGLYTTNGPDACAYIANHSQARVALMEDATHLKKYASVIEEIPQMQYFVVWKGEIPKDLPPKMQGKVMTWKEFITVGEQKYQPKAQQDSLEARMDSAKPGNCATFIYTSGTTGPPKAVMVSHDNYTWITEAVGRSIGLNDPSKIGNQRILSMLPLSHVAAQLTDLVSPVEHGANVFFSDPTALQGNLLKFMLIARPTIFMAVPRVWEKIEEKIAAIGAQTTGLKRKIADWAKSMAPEGTYAEVNGGQTPRGWGLAKKLVFNKIKESLGLDQCESFAFSAAPMKDSTREFFLNLNIYLRNFYGMSEMAGPHTWTDPTSLSSFKGSQAMKQAGVVADGAQICINNPDAEGNGQICMRGRNVFMGYFKNEKETRDTIDSKGFVHSGDIGYISPQRVLYITGRLKELIITAGGENVAPVLIQNQINTALPIFANTVVIGDKRKFLSCLLTLRTKTPTSQELSDQLIDYLKARGSQARTIREARECAKVRKVIEQGLETINKRAISSAQKVHKYTILDGQFSVDGGELTPTLKMKRKIINQKYQVQINSMYEIAKL